MRTMLHLNLNHACTRMALITTAIAMSPALSAAQTTGDTTTTTGVITVRIASMTDREPNEITAGSPLPINKRECEINAEINLFIDKIPTGFNSLDLWRGANCAAIESRTQNTRTCDNIPSAVVPLLGNQTQITAQKFTVQQLFDCSQTFNNSNQDIYFLASNTVPNLVDVGTNWGVLAIAVDNVPPLQVTGVVGSAGKSDIRVSWSLLNDAAPFEYNVYIDPEAGVPLGQTCPPANTTLVAGQPVPENAVRVATRPAPGTSTSFNGTNQGLVFDTQYPVAVTLQDKARNEGPVSELSCITMVRTQGFWDMYSQQAEQNGSSAQSGVGCSLAASGPTSRDVGGWLWVVAALAGYSFASRRERRS
jgi:hypothetical protein